MRSVCDLSNSWFYIVSTSSLFPLSRCELPAFLAPHAATPEDLSPPRRLLFDLGAGLYTSKLGGGSLRFFHSSYGQLGIKFDRIFAWEAKKFNSSEIYDGMPADVVSVISYFNLGVDVTPGAKHNPLRTLREIAKPSDFVVMKIDIDPDSAIETKLIKQLLAEPALLDLIDELYYEHHVHLSPMAFKGWAASLYSTNETLSSSYELFHALRERGIRAHSWV